MTYHQQIFDIAADNYGIVTSAQAKKEGISDKEMSAIVSRGRIRRLGRGVYKIVNYISVKNAPYAETVALVGPGAYLYGESALALLGLASANPARIIVATLKRVRKALPKRIRVEPVPAGTEPAYYEGIPCESVADAIGSRRSHLMPSRLEDAVCETRCQGYLMEAEKREPLTELG